jgi:hypothetical protein
MTNKAIEMADRGSPRHSDSDSRVRGGNRIPPGITGNTTYCDRFPDHGSLLHRRASNNIRSRYFRAAANTGSDSRFH